MTADDPPIALDAIVPPVDDPLIADVPPTEAVLDEIDVVLFAVVPPVGDFPPVAFDAFVPPVAVDPPVDVDSFTPSLSFVSALSHPFMEMNASESNGIYKEMRALNCFICPYFSAESSAFV